MGNKPHKLCIYSPEPRNEVYCLRLNFNTCIYRNWSIWISWKVGAKALTAPPPAGCLPCTLCWTYVSLSLCDRCQWRIRLVSKSSIFRTLFPRLWKFYTVVYISWCRSVSALIIWFKNLAFIVNETAKPETISTTSWSWRCLKIYINSSILLHTTPVYWVWVSVYSCLYFVAAFSLKRAIGPDALNKLKTCEFHFKECRNLGKREN